MSDPFELVKLASTVASAQARPLAARFIDGTVEEVAGHYAAIRKIDPQAAPTPGFFVPPMLALLAGDHVWAFDDGGFKLVLAVLNRNASLRRSEALLMAAQPLTASNAHVLAWYLPSSADGFGALLLRRLTLYVEPAAGTFGPSDNWLLELVGWDDGFTGVLASVLLSSSSDLTPQVHYVDLNLATTRPVYYLRATRTGSPPALIVLGDITFSEA